MTSNRKPKSKSLELKSTQITDPGLNATLMAELLNEGLEKLTPQKLDEYLERGLNVNMQDEKGNSLLHHAVYAGKPPLIIYLLLKHAKVNIRNAKGYAPLDLAVAIDNLEIVQLILKHLIDTETVESQLVKFTPLMIAIFMASKNDKDNKIVNTLLTYTKFYGTLRYSINIYEENENGNAAFDYAFEFNNKDVMRRLLSILNQDQENLLMVSIRKHKERVEKSLQRNLNEEQKEILMLSIEKIEKRIKNIIQTMRELNLDLDVKNPKGQSALMIAVMNSNDPVVQLLIESKCNINSVDSEGMTPLMKAVEMKLGPVCFMLHAAGADPKCGHGVMRYLSTTSIPIRLLLTLPKENLLFMQLGNFVKEFCDPITQHPLYDPVTVPNGHTFNRITLVHHCLKNNINSGQFSIQIEDEQNVNKAVQFDVVDIEKCETNINMLALFKKYAAKRIVDYSALQKTKDLVPSIAESSIFKKENQTDRNHVIKKGPSTPPRPPASTPQ